MCKKVIFMLCLMLSMAAFQAQARQIKAQKINCTTRDHKEYCWAENGTVLDGRVAVKRDNGTIGSISEFENGYRNGESLMFDGRGKLVERMLFTKGTLDGVDVFYHRNGKIWIVAPYMKGLLDGPVNIFNSKGKIRGRFVYNKGILQRGYCKHNKSVKYPNRTSEVAFNQLVTCGAK